MRRIRDEIAERVRALLDELAPDECAVTRPDLGRRALAEGLAAFALVFAGCGAIVANAESTTARSGTVGIALVFGLVIMVMVYATGHLSGAHINPAVTMAFTLTRHFPAREAVAYVAAQLVGAIAGGAWFCSPSGLTSRPSSGRPCPRVGVGSALVYEAILTRLPDVRDHGRGHRHPSRRRRGRDRDRRHGRPRRPVRRAGDRRLDEPGPLVRPGAGQRDLRRPLDLHRRARAGAALGALAYQLVRGGPAQDPSETTAKARDSIQTS